MKPCNYLNRGHKSKVNIFGQYSRRIDKSVDKGAARAVFICLHVMSRTPMTFMQ